MIIDDPNTSSKILRHSASTSSSRTSTKWTEKNFKSPFSQLAILARTKLRERIAIESAWPDNDKDDFIWKCFKDVAAGYDSHLKVYKTIDEDGMLKGALIDYVLSFSIFLFV